MSQAGELDVEQSHPQIPTTFVTNNGTAVPIANTLEILANIVAAHSIPIETTGTGNTVNIVTQFASASGTSSATNAGEASFNSAQFTVDANGFVTFSGTGAGETITGNTGGALSPVAGNWNIFGTSTAAGTTPVQTSGTGNTLTVQVQKAQAIAATNATNVGLAAFNNTQFTVDANGFVSLNGTGEIETLSDDVGTTITPSAGNIQLVGHVNEQGGTKFSTVVAGTHLANINPMSPARWIVDALGFNGTHTTISSAITSATSGDTILILPGTYTENPTMKAGVNLVAFDADAATPNVTILGNVTASYNGSCSISGINFQTNGANCLTVSGTNTSKLNLINCYFDSNNATGISINSANFFVVFYRCHFVSEANNAIFSIAANPGVDFSYCYITAGTTASTISAGAANFFFCKMQFFSLTTSSSAQFNCYQCFIDNSAENQLIFTTAGTGSGLIEDCSVYSGTASIMTIGAGTTATITNSSLTSSNTNVLTGSGTLIYGMVLFGGTSNGINVTTQVPIPVTPQQGGTGVANAKTSTITLGGALTTSGAFASTFTMTNTTAVTFPTSGTLATTSQIPTFPLSPANGGTGVANGTGSTITLGGALTTSGAFGSTFTMTGTTAVTFPTSGTLATTSQIPTFPLSPTNGGTGVSNAAGSTITLGGALTTSGAFASTFTMTNTTAVTFPTSGTLATTSQIPTLPLSTANGGTGENNAATSGTLLIGNGTGFVPTTTTYPSTNAINTLLYASGANAMSALATADSGVLVTSSAGVPSILAAGTTGQVLQASSAGTPAWSTATYPSTAGTNLNLVQSNGTNFASVTPSQAGASLALISTQTPGSVASVTFNNLNTYHNYLLIITNMKPATNAVTFQINFSVNGGTTWLSSGYVGGCSSTNVVGSAVTYGSSTSFGEAAFNVSNGNPAIGGAIHFYALNSSDFPTVSGQLIYPNSSTSTIAQSNIGFYNSNTTVNAIQLIFSSGNISQGSFSLYAYTVT